VYERILKRIRERIRRREFDVTAHARKELLEDAFDVYDVESGILCGAVLERQKDRVTGERKYRIQGTTGYGRPVEIVAKINATGRVTIITVYEP
jgi:hypothetical protein